MDPPMRADPKLSAGNSPVTGSPSLRSNRLPEAAATKANPRAGWITSTPLPTTAPSAVRRRTRVLTKGRSGDSLR